VRAVLIPVLVFAAVALAAGSEFASVRHRLMMERDEVNSEWLQVAVALERRAELIPSLAEMVRRAAREQESIAKSGLFGNVTEARGALAGARTAQEKIAANERLSNVLARLLVLTENYQQLRVDKQLLRLEDEIAAAENSIAVERRKYNETLEHYNSSIQTFPDNMVAALSGFHRNDAYFRTDPGTLTGSGLGPAHVP
jgi:LemA protein